MQTERNIYDITIIGGGPTGLFAAYYASLREAKVKLIESLKELGGQPAHLFPEKLIHDIPGHPQISGAQLTQNLILQSKSHKPTFVVGEEAQTVEEAYEQDGSKYYILRTDKHTHFTRTIIIATGNGAFSPRQLNLSEANQYENHTLHYFVPELQKFNNKTVAICGGGDSAIDWALMLESIAKRVYLIHRRPNFRAHESSIRAVKNSSIEILTPYVPSAIEGDGKKVSRLVINKNRTEEFKELDVDEIIVSYGFTSSFGEMRHWDLNMARGAFEVDHKFFETNRPGIFAIGDSCYYEGKIKLIASGFGEAPQAVNGALLHINPDANIAPIHSTKL